MESGPNNTQMRLSSSHHLVNRIDHSIPLFVLSFHFSPSLVSSMGYGQCIHLLSDCVGVPPTLHLRKRQQPGIVCIGGGERKRTSLPSLVAAFVIGAMQ